MRVVLLVLIVLWPATAQARWAGTAEQWADLQSRDAYGDMDNWFNSLGVIRSPSLDVIVSVGAAIQKRRHDLTLFFFLAVQE